MKDEGRTTKDEGRLILYVDGAARGNPGPAGIGGIIYSARGEKIAKISEYIGETTNNVAEYSALIVGLEKTLNIGSAEILEVRSDSELLVSQLQGEYKVKDSKLKPLYSRLKALFLKFSEVLIFQISREENKEADRLANQAIDKALKGEKREKSLEGIPTQKKLF